jgi:hypothetical protein
MFCMFVVFVFSGCKEKVDIVLVAAILAAIVKVVLVVILVVIFVVILVAKLAAVVVNTNTDEKVKVELFVMSQCPFGVKALNGIDPVLKKIGGNVDFQLMFIGNVDANQPSGFTAMHGQSEVEGNIWQLCAKKHYPSDYEYMKFIQCAGKGMRQIPGNSEACAKTAGMDFSKLQTCATGDEGKGLKGESVKSAKARKATGSPTIYIGDQRYQGGRQENDFLRAICNNFKGTRPAACSNIPEPAKVAAIVLTDSRCKDCNSDRLTRQLKGLFPGLKTTAFDYSTPEGKAKYAELTGKNGKVLLPAFFFDASVEKGDGYSRVQRYLRPFGEWKHLNIGAKWDPAAEICDNGSDDTGNGKVDCADESCSETLTCRKEIPNDLKVFVMSQCPFGVRALDAMEDVLKNFGDDINFSIHMIATEDSSTPSGFKALHGEPEVQENIRELCAFKHYAKNRKYMDYILCRNKNIRSNEWRSCAVNGIDAGVIEKCASGVEGTALHREDIKIGNALGFSASPTWLANNKHKFSGVDPQTIARNFCQYNPSAKNCDKVGSLKGRQAAPSGGGGGGGSCGGQ